MLTRWTAFAAVIFVSGTALSLPMGGKSGRLFFGRRAQRAGAAAVAAFIIAGSLLLAGAALAQTAAPAPPRSTRVDDARAIQATAKVTFGYVLSGDAATDEV